MIRFGLIGCGNIARFHFMGIEKAGGKVTYIADINEETARPWLDKTGAKFSKDYMDLISSPDVDVVSVLASARFHKEMCMAAIAAGKDVICEKTMTNSGEEAIEIVKFAEKEGCLFFTTYMKRFFPAVHKGKQLLPKLGRIMSAHVRSYQQWGDFFTTNELGWAGGVTRNYGGAILKCAGSHMLNMTMDFLGKPDSVYAIFDYVPETDFDRKVTALMEYVDGKTVTFEALAHPLTKIGYEKNSWDEKIEINGVNGRIEIYTVMWDHPEQNGALLRYYDNREETVTEYRYDPVNPFDIELEQIIHAVEIRCQIKPDAAEGYYVDELISAMQKSSELKAAVKIPWKL